MAIWSFVQITFLHLLTQFDIIMHQNVYKSFCCSDSKGKMWSLAATQAITPLHKSANTVVSILTLNEATNGCVNVLPRLNNVPAENASRPTLEWHPFLNSLNICQGFGSGSIYRIVPDEFNLLQWLIIISCYFHIHNRIQEKQTIFHSVTADVTASKSLPDSGFLYR